jgi:transposase
MWEYRSPRHAGQFLDAWCRQVMRSRLEPLKKVAKSLRNRAIAFAGTSWGQDL